MRKQKIRMVAILRHNLGPHNHRHATVLASSLVLMSMAWKSIVKYIDPPGQPDPQWRRWGWAHAGPHRSACPSGLAEPEPQPWLHQWWWAQCSGRQHEHGADPGGKHPAGAGHQ
eukprot:scaffold242249_cov19-Tisochrysis_lutea.AAC.3